MEIYMLKTKGANKYRIGNLIGVEDSRVFQLSEQKTIEDGKKKSWLDRSDICVIKNNDPLKQALFEYGVGYSQLRYDSKAYVLKKIETECGHYYPRIYRPLLESNQLDFMIPYEQREIHKLNNALYPFPPDIPNNRNFLLSSINQLSLFKEKLIDIFNHISPSPSNLNSFGPEIKNLLVLACIEVETQLRGIFVANETIQRKNYTTKQFVLLKSILKLERYQVYLPYFPDLPAIKPFGSWRMSNPSSSLKWYSAYNEIKHNSEMHYAQATLRNALAAVSAVAILLKAQYGDAIEFWNDKIGNFLLVTNNIKWEISEMILPPLAKDDWQIKKFGL